MTEDGDYALLSVSELMRGKKMRFLVHDENGDVVAKFNRKIDAERFCHLMPTLSALYGMEIHAMPERLRPKRNS